MDSSTEVNDKPEETHVPCSHCGNIAKENVQKFLFKNGQLQTFCSKQCLVLKESEVQSCRRCKVKKFDFDMIKISRNANCYYYCSSYCLKKRRNSDSVEIKNESISTDQREEAINEPWEDSSANDVKPLSIDEDDPFADDHFEAEPWIEEPPAVVNLKPSPGVDDAFAEKSEQQGSREDAPVAVQSEKFLCKDNPVSVDMKSKEELATEELISKIEHMKLKTHSNKTSTICPLTESVEIQTEDIEYSNKNEQKGIAYEDFRFFPVSFPVFVPTPAVTIPVFNPMPLFIPVLVPCPIFLPLIEPQTNIKEEDEESKCIEDENEKQISDGELQDSVSDTEMDASESGQNDDMLSSSDTPDMNYLDCLLEELTSNEPPATFQPKEDIEENCKDILKALLSVKFLDKRLINESSFGSDLQSLDSFHGLSLWNKWIELKKGDGTLPTELRYENLNPCLISAMEINKCLTLLLKDLMSDLLKPDGTCYDPNVIFYLFLCIQKHLSDNKFPHSVFSDNVFGSFSDSLNWVLRDYIENNDIMASIPNEVGLVKVREEMLWESQQLGNFTPSILLFTILYFNTKYLKIKTVEDHQLISFRRYIKSCNSTKLDDGTVVKTKSFNFVPQFGTKLCKPFQRNVCAIKENREMPSRCPVKLSEFYISKCPIKAISGSGSFYLLPEGHCVAESHKWYTSESYPASALEKMLNRILMVEDVKEALWNYY